jgi:NAD(P)H-dependent FMN reductase
MSAMTRPAAPCSHAVTPTASAIATALVATFSPRAESRSREGAAIATHALHDAGLATEVVDQRSLPLVAAGLDHELYPDAVQDLLTAAEASDAVVLAAPVHRATVSGITRNALELLRSALNDKPVLPVLAAGSARAHLAAETLRADLYLNFRAVPLRAVVITPEVGDDELRERLFDGVAALVRAVVAR